MIAWRFSLFGLLAAVTFAATACGALVNPNEWWAVGVTTATVALLAYAVLAAIYRHGVRRSFWLGLAVIGWGYFVLPGFAVSFEFEDYGQLPLATSKLLQMLGEVRLRAPSQTIVGRGINSNSGLSGSIVLQYTTGSKTRPGSSKIAGKQARSHFYTIGHCLWSLLLGIAAGLVARRLFLAREQAPRTLLRSRRSPG